MDTAQITTSLTILAMLSLIVLASLFLLLALAGRVLTDASDRSSLGNALGNVCGATAIVLFSMAGIFALRLSVGLDAPLKPDWLNITLRATLTISATWCLIAAGIAIPHLVGRFRKRMDRDERTNVRQDVRETEQNVREVHQDERTLTQDARTVTQDELQVILDDGQVAPIVIDEAVADTIDKTSTDVTEVKADVKELQRRMDKENT